VQHEASSPKIQKVTTDLSSDDGNATEFENKTPPQDEVTPAATHS
jgi:hypothetical protein